MKLFLLLSLLLNSLPLHAAETTSNPDRYQGFITAAEKHRAAIKEEGFGYMVGGSLGLGLSVGLGIASEEALPKLGYSLIQVLSATAITYGASQYFFGDGFTAQADELKELANQLETQKIPEEAKRKILEAQTSNSVRTMISKYRKMKRIRGYLELASVAASGSTLALSKSKGSASNAALGFIILISAVGAYSDLTGSSVPANFQELYADNSFEIYFMPGKGTFQGSLAFRW